MAKKEEKQLFCFVSFSLPVLFKIYWFLVLWYIVKSFALIFHLFFVYCLCNTLWSYYFPMTTIFMQIFHFLPQHCLYSSLIYGCFIYIEKDKLRATHTMNLGKIPNVFTNLHKQAQLHLVYLWSMFCNQPAYGNHDC